MGRPDGRGRPQNPRGRPITTREGRRRRARRQGASSLTPFGEIVRRSARSLGLEPAVQLVEAREAWGQIVGAALAEFTRVVGWRGGVLTVSTSHPLVAQEIRLKRSQILSALEERSGQAATRLQVIVTPKGEMG